MEWSDGYSNSWDDDAEPASSYPPAPLPAHERPWRHPSEVGEQQWSGSEPPLALGRGLSAATGALGMMLAGAVLWTMVPSSGQSAAVPISAESRQLTPPASVAEATPSVGDTSSTASSTLTSRVPTSTTGTSAPPTTAAPTPTMQVSTTIDPQTVVVATPPAAAPVAVSVGDGSILLTTARAVGDQRAVNLTSAAGANVTAEVLVVDGALGVAVLALPSTGASAADMQIGPAPVAGDSVTVVSADATSATVALDADGLRLAPLDAPGETLVVAEGAPVVNADGLLVGLCTMDDAGVVHVVVVATLPDLSKLAARGGGGWLGVEVGDSTDGVTVDTVAPDSPAADAGVQAGDVIASIDGQQVTTATELFDLVSSAAIGSELAVELLRGSDTVTVTVVIEPRPDTL